MTTLSISVRTALDRVAWIAMLLFLVLPLAACGSNDDASAQSEPGERTYTMGDPIEDSTLAAVVTSEYGADTLTAEEFRGQYQMIVSQMPQIAENESQARELRKNILEDFVITHALFGEADKLGVNVDDAQVDQRIDQIRQQFPDEETFEQALAADGLTMEELRENIRDMLRQEQMLNRMSEEVSQPSENEMNEFRESQAQQIQAQHILFLTPDGATEESRDSIEQEARAVLDSIKSGADFAEMARRHSEDGTAQMGGDLGYFSRGQMVAPFEEAAFALADSGDVTTDLVETQYGYHIIRKTGEQTGALMDTTQARQMLTQTRRREAVEDAVGELRRKVTVRLNPDIVETELG